MKKVCLLIHGYLTDEKDFTTLPDSLNNYYDHLELFLIPGHGSETMDNFTKEKVFEKIDKVVKQLEKDYDIMDVIGFSLGGALAKYVACKYKVNKLVLLAPAVKYFSPKTISRRINFMMGNKLTDEKSKFSNIVKEDVEAVSFFIGSLKKKFNLKNYREFANIIAYINETTTDYNAKTLIIWGYFDELVPKAAVKMCYDECQNENKSVIVIPNIGHYMLRSSRGGTIQTLIMNFLK